MTAEIIPFRHPRHAPAIIEVPSMVARAMPMEADVLVLDAAPVDAPSDGVAVAALTLIAACRELTASLAIFGAHCRSAEAIMAEIGADAAAIAKGGGVISRSAASLMKDGALCSA